MPPTIPPHSILQRNNTDSTLPPAIVLKKRLIDLRHHSAFVQKPIVYFSVAIRFFKFSVDENNELKGNQLFTDSSNFLAKFWQTKWKKILTRRGPLYIFSRRGKNIENEKRFSAVQLSGPRKIKRMRRRNQLILTLLKVLIASFLFMKSLDSIRSKKKKEKAEPHQISCCE